MKDIFIIAEMSANHCKDIDLAKKIIKKAKECGADAVKIQTYTADTLTLNCNNDIFKAKGELWKGKTLYELYKEAYTPWEWQNELFEYAKEENIIIFSTPFDKTSIDFLETINNPIYKIASFEAIDYPLIEYAASKQKPMIISTGISSFQEIQEAIDVCKNVGNNDITILKCTSSYPAKLDDMNIITIKDMYERFKLQGVKVGLSDHSMSNIPCIAAVALGAVVIEKHMTLDKSLGGVDSGFSIEPEEFKTLVKHIRETQKALGEVNYSVNEVNRLSARSLFCSKDIKKGEIITSDNIKSIRPSNGLHPKHYNEILGKVATKNIAFATPLDFDMFK